MKLRSYITNHIDHDGDQITSKFIFTKEANEEAERIMVSKSNILTIDGGSIRSIGNEGIQCYYYRHTKFLQILNVLLQVHNTFLQRIQILST